MMMKNRITDAFKASQEKEALLNTLLDAIPVPVYLKDRDGLYLGLNRTFEKFFSIKRDQLIGKTAFEVSPPELAEFYGAKDKELFESGGVQQYEAQVRDAHGVLHEALFNKAVFTDSQGTVKGLVGTILDITEHKQAEKAILRQSALTRAVNRVLQETLFAGTDEELGRLCLAAAEELTGSKFGWIGEVNSSGRLDTIALSDPGWDACKIPESNRPEMLRNMKIRGLLARVLKEGKSLIVNDPATHPDRVGIPEGHPELTAFLGVPLKTAGKTTGMIALADKPSGYQAEDQEAMEALSVAIAEAFERRRADTERKRLMAAIGQSGEVVMVTDPKGTIQYVNPAFEAVTGYTPQEALGQNPRILKSGEQDEAFYRDLWTTISSGKTWNGRMVNKRKDGTLYTEDAVISPVYDAAGAIVNYVAVKRDVTEHLRLAAQFHQAQKLESLGRLAGGVAHDYNNMLSVILGYTEMAMARVDRADPLYHDLKEIRGAARRSADITRQLLAFARRQTIAPRTLDLNETVDGMLKMLRRLMGENINLAWLPQAGLWPVKMDPAQVDQILANLCVNARDAIGDVGKVTVETGNVAFDEVYCASHAGFKPGEYVLLAVTDDGCGMNKETLERIFEPFFTTKEVGKGTGLGLATVYGIVKQNEGFINVYSEPGKGTTFKIYLPRYEGAVAEVKAERMVEFPKGRGETVLLVEDEPAILNMGRIMLEGLDYTVLAAGSPGEAMRLTEEYSGDIHLLLTDVVMPEMNGRGLAARLRVQRPGIKCLYMSGYTANAVAHHGVLEEGVNFIQKPFTLKHLAVEVRKALDKK
jgi:PAS domain S-box-containing protein